jgi:PEP-CTERM motif
MVKRNYCFPSCVAVMALLCTSIFALADNVNLASAQPDFGRAVILSYHPIDSDTPLLSLTFRENSVFSETPAAGRITDHFVPISLAWSHEWGSMRYPDFRDSDHLWKKHPHAVPEPSSLMFLGTAVLGVAFRLRKRLR